MTQREPEGSPRFRAKVLERRPAATEPPARSVEVLRGNVGDRLRRLSEIRRLLGRAVPPEQALPEIAAIVDGSLPVHAMVLVVGARRDRRSVVWGRRGATARELRAARGHALRWSAYLGGAAAWSARELWSAGPDRPRLHRATRRMRAVAGRTLTMPIGAPGGVVLGTLLLGAAGPVLEDDLVFLNQVAALFADALRREPAGDAPARGPRPPSESDPCLDDVVEGVLVIDDRERIGFASAAARRLLGIDGDPIEGRDVHDVLAFTGPWGGGPPVGASPVTRALRSGAASTLGDGELAVGAGDARLRCTVVPLRAGELGGAGSDPGAVTGAVVVLRDAETVRRSEQSRRRLALSAATLVTSLEPEETLEAVTRIPVPVLADLCCIDRFADDGTVDRRPPVCAHDLDGATRWRIVRRHVPVEWESPQDQVLRRGETLLCTDVQGTVVSAAGEGPGAPAVEIPITSMVVVPLLARGRLLGAMTFAMTDSRRRFVPSDLRDLEEVADRTAHALESASLFRREQLAARSREDILAVVSHDLRNPLGVVIGGAALLLEMPLADDRRRRLIQAIQRAAQRMRRLIGDLLDASCLDGGRLSMEIGRQPADALVHDAVDMVAHPPPTGRQLRFVAEADSVAGASVVCDRDRILQVFSNLIGNAIDFTPDGGTIRIGARREGDDVVFYVADEGPGIATQHHGHVFERFWQHRRTPGPRRGLGLGLPIAKGIVETHGGRIWVESAEGRGSVFFFSLHAVLTASRSGG